MEKVGRRVRSSQPRVKGALWTGYMRVNYKPFHKYKHISFTRPYNIAPHTHAHAHTHTYTQDHKKSFDFPDPLKWFWILPRSEDCI